MIPLGVIASSHVPTAGGGTAVFAYLGGGQTGVNAAATLTVRGLDLGEEELSLGGGDDLGGGGLLPGALGTLAGMEDLAAVPPPTLALAAAG